MAGLNKIMIIGNLGNDPEMRYTANGEAMTSFRIATNRSYTARDGERREETEWFSVVAFRQLAERVSQYLTKGQMVYVEGRLRSRTWESQDGTQRFTNEINANEVVFMDRPQSQTTGEVEESQEATVDPEDLPF
ncbi:single-stranded DNA-binding protein [Dehalococcoidia bacterium]|nr:single-stranded DNA-binding protein [Dehalococcoidia bacterium]